MSTHELLIKAREIQAERGHCQGIIEDRSGHVCMAGAIMLATDGALRGVTPWPTVPREQIEALGFDPTYGWQDLCQWNNYEGRTLEQVLERFDQGIAATAEPCLV